MFPALQNTREQQTGGFLTGARNFANRALGCPTEAKLFPGEKHAQLGRCSASYMGPGTRFLTRVERGDVGRGPIDSLCSYEHDRAYSKAGVGMQRGDLTEDAAGEIVQAADTKFLACVSRHRASAPANAALATKLFRVKRAAEDKLGFPRAAIAKLSKANITEMKTLGPERVDSLLDRARDEKWLENVQKQSGMGMVPRERMLKAIRGVSDHFAARGNTQPTTKQVTSLLKKVVRARTRAGKRIIPANDPTSRLNAQLSKLAGGSWADTASTALGTAGMFVPGPVGLAMEGASGLLALGDLIFG